jgi:hypothetical protein
MLLYKAHKGIKFNVWLNDSTFDYCKQNVI